MKYPHDAEIHYLKPAGFYFLKKPGVIRTVLGSCITVTMYCRRNGFASACHPVLPWCREERICYFAGCKDKYKFVGCVIPEMARLFIQSGVKLDELEVKLFGGSEMLTTNSKQSQIIQVGRKNVEMAETKLEALNIKLKSFDTGGTLGRRLFFDTRSGDVWIKKLTKSDVSIFEKKDIEKQVLLQRDK